jgi:simple sugar transport system ATP-binding protein
MSDERAPAGFGADPASTPAPAEPAATPVAERADTACLLEARNVSKYFGSVNALQDISLRVNAGEVTCVLGDNGAGSSTLIKILSGVHSPDKGELLLEGEVTHFATPRGARAAGIATVFQDLATVPPMSVWRNFFLGNEPTRGRGMLQRLDIRRGPWAGASSSSRATPTTPIRSAIGSCCSSAVR